MRRTCKRKPRQGGFFLLPNEIFTLGLSAGEIAVYAYLLFCEDRETHLCYPSFRKIGEHTGMCSEDTILQSIKEAVHLGEGHFERNSSLEALLLIVEANKTNELWKVIRKEYLRQNLQFDKTRYQLIDVSEEEKGHAIFAVRGLETGKQIAWICVDTNLYIVANALKPQYENQPEWKKENGSVWRYVSPHGGNERFPLRNPTTSIITESTLEIGDLLDQISF